MSTRIDKVLLEVLCNGTHIESVVESVQVKLGYDLRVNEATVNFANVPDEWNPWDTLVINTGLQSTGSDTTGLFKRFDGYALDPATSNWPYSPKLIGRGGLILADKLLATTDAYGDALLSPVTPQSWWDLASSTGWVDGIDLTNGSSAGQTDIQMITHILTLCGLAGRINFIGGQDTVYLGTVAWDQFVWRRDQSGLSTIEMIDKMFKYRTYENLAGQILRAATSSFAPFEYTIYTLNEGADIFAGSSITRDVQNIKNMVTVQGYDDGSGPFVYVAAGGVSILPPGVAYQTETLNSPLIEKTQRSDSGGGISCEEVAQWMLNDLKYPMIEATIVTWRDEPFQPGMVIYVNAPHLLGINQSVWIKSVTIDVAPGSFTQTLVVRAQDYIHTSPGVIPVTIGSPSFSSGAGTGVGGVGGLLPMTLSTGSLRTGP